MVFGTETSSRLKLRLMNVSKKDLLKDLESAVDHDMSVLFKKVYEEEYGTFGGHPYSLLIGDYSSAGHGLAATSFESSGSFSCALYLVCCACIV